MAKKRETPAAPAPEPETQEPIAREDDELQLPETEQPEVPIGIEPLAIEEAEPEAEQPDLATAWQELDVSIDPPTPDGIAPPTVEDVAALVDMAAELREQQLDQVVPAEPPPTKQLWLKLERAYIGRMSGERWIQPGVYAANDPALFGLSAYLLTRGHATLVEGQE